MATENIWWEWKIKEPKKKDRPPTEQTANRRIGCLDLEQEHLVPRGDLGSDELLHKLESIKITMNFTLFETMTRFPLYMNSL